MDATNSLQCENLAGPGNYKNSICPVEARKDSTLVVSNLQLFQSSLISLPTLAPEDVGHPDVLLQPGYYPTAMDLMCDAQPNEPGGPGNAMNSICSSEAPRDTAPAIRGSQHFQNRTCYSSEEENNNNLSIYYQNVRGLRTKIDDFYIMTQNGDYDAIVLTETWLNNEINSTQLFGSEYTVYRKDRDPNISGKLRGGGV